MDKILILKICVFVNILFLVIFVSSFFIFNNAQSNYFNVGWSKNFIFVSYTIDTPFKYFTLCVYIVLLNSIEVYLNDISYPIITFSTYNPYKKKINDFSRIELEMYSNIIFFTQTLKKMLQVMITLSQIDIACISLLSSQISAYFAIKYLLDNKSFENKNIYLEVDTDIEELTECKKYSYQSINDLSMNI